MHFSSVFTREDTSSLPVPETKFNESEEERLGQLVVTPEVVASKIKNIRVQVTLALCQVLVEYYCQFFFPSSLYASF